MDNFETTILVMAALASSGLGVVVLVGWWLHGAVHTGAEEMREDVEELRTHLDRQAETLTTMSTALHHTRVEMGRVHSQVGGLRAELDAFVHGPPSLRSPQAGARELEKTP